MSETDPTATDGASIAPPPPIPGERRLAHPPSDRYRETAPEPAEVGDSGASVARGLSIAIVAAILGVVAIVLLGGVAAISAGLVVVAAAMGWAIGIALRLGAGDHLARRRRAVLAIAIAVVAVAVAQIGLWQYGLTEGGVLPLTEYLLEVYGPLVPLELAVAAAVAWLAAR